MNIWKQCKQSEFDGLYSFYVNMKINLIELISVGLGLNLQDNVHNGRTYILLSNIIL